MQAVRWLAIHGSNCFGNDKVSLDDRHSWVLQHQQEILECAEDPFSHAWWHEADEPFCFLAFCLEWAGYVREGLDFVSHIPVAMDGTCNGLQIFSLILRDKVGGSAVNLLPAAKPQDIYQIVADKVIGKLKTDAADPDKDAIVTTKEGKAFYNPAKSAAILLDMDINRKTTKRQVMVLPYLRHQGILPGVQRRMGQRHNPQRLPAASRRRLHPGPLLLPLNACMGRDRRNRHRGAGRHEVPARHGRCDEQARPAHQMDNTSRIPGCTEIYG